MTNTISERQLFIITATGFTLNKIYVMPAYLSGIAHQNLWASALLNLIIDYFLLVISLKIITSTNNKPLFLSSQNTFPKSFTKVIFLIYAIFFMLKAFLPIFEQKNSIEFTFYETQPTLLTFMPFYVVAFYIITKGYRAFARSFEISVWVYIVAILIVLLLAIPAGKYSALLPIVYDNPKSVILGSFKSLLWFGDPIYILFFAGYISNYKNNLKSIKLAYVISSFVTILILVAFYAVFDSISPRQYYATLKMSKYSFTLSNIGRLDYISSFLLAGISVFQVTLPLLFANTCLNKFFNFKHKFISPFIIIAFQVSFSILFRYDFLRLINIITKYFIYFFIIMTYVIPFIYYLKTRRNKYGL